MLLLAVAAKLCDVTEKAALPPSLSPLPAHVEHMDVCVPVNETSQAGANAIKLIRSRGRSDVLIVGTVLGFSCVVEGI